MGITVEIGVRFNVKRVCTYRLAFAWVSGARSKNVVVFGVKVRVRVRVSVRAMARVKVRVR